MNYPQLDIRSYDPQMSGDLANLVMGRFDFTGLPHELRVQRLYTLIEFFRAVQRVGDLEHTGDWDWRIEVWHAPQNERSEISGTNEDRDVWSDEIGLPYRVEPNDYMTAFARWEFLNVLEIDGESGEDSTVRVPIDNIRLIHIGFA